jgi:hypothetical protein
VLAVTVGGTQVGLRTSHHGHARGLSGDHAWSQPFVWLIRNLDSTIRLVDCPAPDR